MTRSFLAVFVGVGGLANALDTRQQLEDSNKAAQAVVERVRLGKLLKMLLRRTLPIMVRKK